MTARRVQWDQTTQQEGFLMIIQSKKVWIADQFFAAAIEIENGKITAAICAAPTILSDLGYLDGKRAVCYPSMMDELLESAVDGEETGIDKWLVSRFNGHIGIIRTSMEKFDLRQLASTAYFEMFNDMKWYTRRGGNNRSALMKALRMWINAMMPITPHTAEELWETVGFEGLVSDAQLPEYDEGLNSPVAEYGEDLIRNVIADSAQIIKVTGMQPSKVILYTASAWKNKVFGFAADLLEEGKLDIPGLTKKCMAEEDLRKNGKAVSELAKKTAADHMRSTPEKLRPIIDLDETAHLASASEFISQEIGFAVEIMNADAEGIYDPQNKARVAIPGRPAIFIE